MEVNDISNVNTGATGASGLSSTNAYTYTTTAVTENCSTCLHSDVCKYRQRNQDIQKKLYEMKDIPSIFSIVVKCEFYANGSPFIINSPDTNPPYWYDKKYEVTCCCDKED